MSVSIGLSFVFLCVWLCSCLGVGGCVVVFLSNGVGVSTGCQVGILKVGGLSSGRYSGKVTLRTSVGLFTIPVEVFAPP